MKALVITPGKKNSARLIDTPEPAAGEGSILCEMLGVGVCGTDKEILAGEYGTAPKDDDYLILGHESLGRVLEAPANSGFKKGDLLVGIVRHPDPLPCQACAHDEWDMCTNGLYTERGIKDRHGFCSEQFRVEPDFAIPMPADMIEVGVLLEPTSVVAKAWDHTLKILGRGAIYPRRVLVTGAGPVGLLAAMIGRQKGFDVHIYDHNAEGNKPDRAKELGATYHSDLDKLKELSNRKGKKAFDILIECTGVPDLIFQLVECLQPSGILCLTGVSSGGRKFGVDIGKLNREIVLQNEVIFGTVNANRRHFDLAVEALQRADRPWLKSLITRRVQLNEWQSAFTKVKGDIKTVLVPR